MRQTIGINLHGVLDTYPHILKPFMKIITNLDIANINIVSGPPTHTIIKELNDLGYYTDVHFNNVFSVVDFLIHEKEKMWKDDNDLWWSDDNIWWNAKARICEENGIDCLIDNDEKYSNGFKLINKTFINIDSFIKDDKTINELVLGDIINEYILSHIRF